jgi:predicted phosphodiesterase
MDELNVGDAIKNFRTESTSKEALGAIKDLLERNNIDLDEVGKLTRISLYQTAAKDPDGELIAKDLVGIQISPKWESGPEWPVVQPAQPVVIKPPAKPAAKKQTPALIGGWETAVILPDPQIGFRQFEDGLDPFHDDAAMDVALQITNVLEHEGGVHQVVNLGDFLDLPAQGRFEQEAAFAFTSQHAIDRGHLFLQQQRAVAPDAKIILLEGNHDRRMQKFIQNNALASFGIKKANAPESWPVMSLPNLLRLDEIDVEYIDAYPAGMWWINEKLRAIHGDKVNSGGNTAMKYTNEMPHISTVFGHIHRQEIQSKTTFDRAGKIKVMGISPGCLCRVDGAVPSVKGSTDVNGRPVVYYENWQQGMAVITYKPEGSFHVDLVHIDDGKTLFRGQEFKAKTI